MRTDDEVRAVALRRIDSAVEEWFLADDELIEVMACAIDCGVSHNEVARRVTVYSRPTVLTALALIRRKTRVNELLADAGIRVMTSDDTEEVWVHTASKPRRGVTVKHDGDNLTVGGAPGTPGWAAVAAQVAAKVVACLYDAGFELVEGTTRLTRKEAEVAFAAPDACLWIEESART